MKRYLIIASFVFAQIYAQFAVYDPSYGIDKIDAMLFAPALGGLLWIGGVGVLCLVLALIQEMEKKQ